MLIYASMHRIPRGLAPIAFISALAYGAIIRFKNTLYETSLLSPNRLRNPVISIGNITTGGAGKTPLVIFAAKKITEMGMVPAILSRGYGRPDPAAERIISPKNIIESPGSYMGDEPALIRRHVPEAWFGISKNRFAAGSRIEQKTDNLVFILDDGFQHRKLHRDLDLVVIDSSQPLEKKRIFPHGDLREPLHGLCRGHATILNGGPEAGISSTAHFVIEKYHLQEKTLYCEQLIERLVPFDLWKESDNSLPARPNPESVFLTAALGNPDRFRSDVMKLGIRVSGSIFFRDHYSLRPADWVRCVKTAREDSADAIIVTEKDAIKISEPVDFPLLVAVQTTRFSNPEAFEDLLRQGINNSLQVKR